MKWLTAGVIVLAVALAGAGWYGWQTIQQLEGEVEALNAETARLEADAETQERDATEVMGQVVAHVQATFDDRLTTIEADVDGLRSDLGVAASSKYQSVWDAVNELWAIIPGLASTPPPVIVEAPAPVSSEPTAQWCAEYLLALENAGNLRTYVPPPAQSDLDDFLPTPAGPSFGMNAAEYHDWVVVPMIEIGCPSPNEE